MFRMWLNSQQAGARDHAPDEGLFRNIGLTYLSALNVLTSKKYYLLSISSASF